jgi:hypothetical protein
MSEASKKSNPLKAECPRETEGVKAARKVRAVCNNLTDEERAELTFEALEMVYGKNHTPKSPRGWDG